MKILISHVYSDQNNGDAALLSVLISDIRRAFANADVTILTMDKVDDKSVFDGVRLRNSFMYYASTKYKNFFAKSLYSFFIISLTILWALFYRFTKIRIPVPSYINKVISSYTEADLIIPVGGGYIRSRAGFAETAVLAFIIHPLIFGYILGKPTINYTQSVGPFGSWLQEAMAKFAVKRLDGIVVRENISLDLLKKWNVTKNVFLSVDCGFAFVSDVKKDIRVELGIPKDKMLVGITVRNWMKAEKQISYEKSIANLADSILEKYGARIVFIPQVTVENHNDDDRESSKKVYGYMKNKDSASLILNRYDHRSIKAMYGSLDYLIGTRFHSVIFALTSHVPAIAVEYEHKTRGIMADLGLEQWVADIRNIEVEDMVKLFDKLVNDREGYVQRLKDTLPPYIERSKQTIKFVKDIYEQIE